MRQRGKALFRNAKAANYIDQGVHTFENLGTSPKQQVDLPELHPQPKDTQDSINSDYEDNEEAKQGSSRLEMQEEENEETIDLPVLANPGYASNEAE